MPAYIDHGESVDAKTVILSIVTTETVIRNPVAVVTAALLPGAMLGLPAMCTITLPSDLLHAYLLGASLLCRPVVLLLTLLPLLILLPLGLLLLFLSCRVVLPLTLLPLLIRLPLSLLLLFMFRGLVLLLTLLPLLALLPLSLLLLFRLSLFFLFLRFLLLVLPRISWRDHSEKQKQPGRTNHSNWFHDVASITAYGCARHSSYMLRLLFPIVDSPPWLASLPSAVRLDAPTSRRGHARGSGTIQIR
jgi:hypothetical protein